MGNQLAMDQMEQIKGSILKTLKIRLHNNAITLSMRIAEHQEGEPVLSRKDQYELIVKENPAIGRLRELFDLVLA